ncbi:hypothetical protein MVEN_00097400 [Mycena venus]|uniref:Uncharacterized protein n=1 Tax=Mycena venus TaxID=2733690 RepID=A0A8H7DIB5_9AGAR|nr:hypothetical protein MVEN_00097400 [Mycena venus]
MSPDIITLNRESPLDWNTNDGSIYTCGSHNLVNGAKMCLYIFHRRMDDVPLTQLGEISGWIKNGQRRLTFVVGNFYNELVCSKVFLESEDISTFATCPAAGGIRE